MRLFAIVGMLAVGVGCGASAEPPPKAPPSYEPPTEVPLVAPDDPPPSAARPKLTEPVTIGMTEPGVPAGGSNHGRVIPSTNGAAPRRDLFAEDRAKAPYVRRQGYGYNYRYRVQNTVPAAPPVTNPNGGSVMPSVGGNWPTAPSFGRSGR